MFSKAREVDVPVDLTTKRLEPISKLPEMEAFNVMSARPFTVKLPPTEAKVPISIPLVNWVEAPVNDQRPVTVSFWDNDAGPSAESQLRLKWAAEPEALIANFPPSKEREETFVLNSPPISLISMLDPPPPPDASVPHSNLPVLALQLRVSPDPEQPSVPEVGKAEPKKDEAEA